MNKLSRISGMAWFKSSLILVLILAIAVSPVTHLIPTARASVAEQMTSVQEEAAAELQAGAEPQAGNITTPDYQLPESQPGNSTVQDETVESSSEDVAAPKAQVQEPLKAEAYASPDRDSRLTSPGGKVTVPPAMEPCAGSSMPPTLPSLFAATAT